MNCEICYKIFKRKYNYDRHFKSKLHYNNVELNKKNNEFTKKSITEPIKENNIIEELEEVKKKYYCNYCTYVTCINCNFKKHLQNIHKKNREYCKMCNVRYSIAYDHDDSYCHMYNIIDLCSHIIGEAKKAYFLCLETTKEDMKKRKFKKVIKD